MSSPPPPPVNEQRRVPPGRESQSWTPAGIAQPRIGPTSPFPAMPLAEPDTLTTGSSRPNISVNRSGPVKFLAETAQAESPGAWLGGGSPPRNVRERI